MLEAWNVFALDEAFWGIQAIVGRSAFQTLDSFQLAALNFSLGSYLLDQKSVGG